jgi:hypothetical protein
MAIVTIARVGAITKAALDHALARLFASLLGTSWLAGASGQLAAQPRGRRQAETGQDGFSSVYL